MRISTIAYIGSGAVLFLGIGMFVWATRLKEGDGAVQPLAEVRHLVTDQMQKDAEALGRKQGATFETKSIDGKPVTIARRGAERPQFVSFILDGCPCSVDAQPIYESLYRHFEQKIDFVGVIDSEGAKAAKWAKQMAMPYPLVSDPSLKIVRAYEVPYSAYAALIDREGRIVKMWPGYSKAMFEEMNQKMAKLLGEAPRPFDTAYAPIEPATGCAFPPK